MAKYEILVNMGPGPNANGIQWKPGAILIHQGKYAGFLPNSENHAAWEELKHVAGEDVGQRIIKKLGEIIESGEPNPVNKLRWELVNEPFIFMETPNQEGM